MKKTAKKKIGRPRGRKALHRPVLSARVPFDYYMEIMEASVKANRTMSEELIYRAKGFTNYLGKLSREDDIVQAIAALEVSVEKLNASMQSVLSIVKPDPLDTYTDDIRD